MRCYKIVVFLEHRFFSLRGGVPFGPIFDDRATFECKTRVGIACWHHIVHSNKKTVNKYKSNPIKSCQLNLPCFPPWLHFPLWCSFLWEAQRRRKIPCSIFSSFPAPFPAFLPPSESVKRNTMFSSNFRCWLTLH